MLWLKADAKLSLKFPKWRLLKDETPTDSLPKKKNCHYAKVSLNDRKPSITWNRRTQKLKNWIKIVRKPLQWTQLAVLTVAWRLQLRTTNQPLIMNRYFLHVRFPRKQRILVGWWIKIVAEFLIWFVREKIQHLWKSTKSG